MKRDINTLTKWEAYEKKMMEKPSFKKKVQELAYEYQLAKNIIELRRKRGISQEQLAKKVGTKQPVISRVETAATKPTFSLIQRVAKALDARLEVRLR